MAQFYTLDEAAERLGLGVDELKRRLKTEWTAIRPFRDGPTLRFRTADIDELARSLGQASDPGLTLGPPGSALGDSSEEMAVPDSGHDLSGEDIFTVRGGEQKKAPADSDVRLDVPSGKVGAGANQPTDELSIDLGSPSSGKLTAPKSSGRLAPGGPAKIPGPEDAPASSADSSSEFELSLDADSDSFDLQLSTDSGNEVDLGAVLDAPGGASGINLAKPSDSGVSLEKKKKGPTPPPSSADSDVDFELSLDAGAPRSGGARKPGQPTMGDDSSSEFELTLDDNSGVAENLAQSLQAQAESGQGDIFETDFELPAVGDDSGSEVVAVDDTDLEGAGYEVDVAADDESASQVMLVDSDEAAAVLDEADAEEAGAALAGVHRLADDDERVVAVAAPPAPWPGWVVAPLALTLLFAFLGGLMSFESIRGMWGYHQPGKPANALVRGMADTLGMKVSD